MLCSTSNWLLRGFHGVRRSQRLFTASCHEPNRIDAAYSTEAPDKMVWKQPRLLPMLIVVLRNDEDVCNLLLRHSGGNPGGFHPGYKCLFKLLF